MIYTSEVGDNSDLIAHVAALYLKSGDRIWDVTYGKGVFWRKLDQNKYRVRLSDILCGPEHIDFRHLPPSNEKYDCVILDPPYCHNPGQMIIDKNYRNAETTKGLYHKDIIRLYDDGMREAFSVLKTGGYLWVKCKDEIESSYQRWSHIEVYNAALKIGFFAQDLFILTQKSNPIVQHKRQQHARKNHSYLWVFKKPNEREERMIKRVRL